MNDYNISHNQRGVLDNQQIPFPPEPHNSTVSPHISKAVQKCLNELRGEAIQSLKWIASAQKISKSEEYEHTIQGYKDTIKEIDAFANFLLTVSEVTDEDMGSVEEWKGELRSLQQQLKGAVDRNELSEDLAKQAEEGIEKAGKVLGQLQSLAETIIKYQEKSKPLEALATTFCDKWATNPLDAADKLQSLLTGILKLDHEMETFSAGLEGSLSGIKLQDAHDLQMKCLDNEIDDWVYDTEKELASQIKHLKYLLNHQDTAEREKAQKQLAALKAHVNRMLIPLLKKSHSDDRGLPKEIPSHMRKLRNLLSEADKKLEQLGKFDAGGLKYGSEEWNQLVSSRPPIPQGMLSYAFSYLNPLGYIPEKWRPTTTQVTNAFILALVLGNEVAGINQRLTEAKDMKRRADDMQKAVFDAVPKEAAATIEKEAALIGNLLDRGLSKVNLEKLTKTYPEALPTLQAAAAKFGSDLTKEQITKVVQDHITARMVALSPKGNPYADRWARLWPNADMVQEPASSTRSSDGKNILGIGATAHEDTPASVHDVALPVIEDIGIAGGLLDVVTEDGVIPPSIVWGVVKEVVVATDDIEEIIKSPVVGIDVRDESSTLIKDLNRTVSNIPPPNTPAEQSIGWIQDVKGLIRQVDKVKVQVAEMTPAPSSLDEFLSTVTPPAELEKIYRKENRQLVRDTIDLPAQAPSDKIYANLIGLYRPDLSEASIQGKELEGLPSQVPLNYLLDTEQAYLQALSSHPDYSSSCRQEACHAIFGDSEFSKLAARDVGSIQKAIEKINFANQFFSLSPLEQSRLLEKTFNALEPGENLFFETGFGGAKAGHAMIFEIEKASDGGMILRLINTGMGVKNHGTGVTQFGGGILPFFEIVDIDPQRLLGGSFTNFLDVVKEARDGDKDWSPALFYDVILASTGGKVSSRKDASSLLRDSQYVGNCGIASSMAVLDKTLVSAALAERMRSLTMVRATKAYYEANLQEIVSGKEKESKRRLLLIGSQATFESIERAIEVGGLVGEEAKELLQTIKQIHDAVSRVQNEDLGLITDSSLSFTAYKKSVVDKPKIDPASLQDIESSSIFKSKKASSKTVVSRPTARKQKATFVPLPFQDRAVEKLAQFGKQLNSQDDSVNQAAIITSLEFDELFQLGFQNTRDLISASSIDALKITDNLALFNQNLANFLDNDKLRIIQELLLDPKVLEQNLANDQGLILAINKFCSKGRKLGHLIQNAATEGFFAYLSRTVQQTLGEIPATSSLNIDKKSFLDSSDIFQQLIADSDHEQETERLKIIHFYRIKSFETHNQLTLEETGELLSSINYLVSQGFPKDLTTEAKAEVKKIWDLVEVSQRHLDDDKSATKILNQIATGIDPEHKDCQWRLHPTYAGYVNEDETMFYNPETGTLDKQMIGRTDTPQILKNDPVFLSVVVGSSDARLDRIKDNIYVYKDPQGVNYRFVVSRNEIVTQRKFNSEWYQAFDPKGLVAVGQPSGTPWHEGGILWAPLSKGEELYYTGPGGHPFLHLHQEPAKAGQGVLGNFAAGVKNAVLGSTVRLETELVGHDLQKTGMNLVDISKTSFSEVIDRIEDPQYTFSFVKDGQLVKTILPRLNLEFEASGPSGDKVLACKKLDGFGLFSGKQALPIFGDFIEYVPLKKIGENNREEMGVLIPYLGFAPQETEGLKTPTALTDVSKDWKEKVPYFFYRIQGDTLIPDVSSKSQAVQANLHLATIFLSERRYAETEKYLNIVDSLLKSMGQVDQEIVQELLQVATFSKINQDKSPDAVALRLRAEAMLRRLVNLHQTKPIEIDSEKDYGFYAKHVSRVNAAFRLSSEENQLIGQAYKMGKATPPSEYAFPISKMPDSGIGHPELNIFAPQQQGSVSENTFSVIPTDISYLNGGSAGTLIVSTKPLFVNAFPEGILPVYNLLKNPADIGLSQRIKIAHQFGLDPTIDAASLKSSMMTLVELRYRYLVDFSKMVSQSDKKGLTLEQVAQMELELELLEPEINLIGTLISTSLGRNKDSSTLQVDVAKHNDLVATLRTVPKYSQEIQAYDQLHQKLSGDALNEALRLWESWVTPNALPIALSVQHSSRQVDAVIGPILTESLLKLSEGQSGLEFAVSYAALHKNRAATIVYNSPVASAQALSTYFKIETEALVRSPSPFSLPDQDSLVAKVFKEQELKYQEFLDNSSSTKSKYELMEKQKLVEQVSTLKAEVVQIRTRIATLEQTLISKLNQFSEVPSLKAHSEARLARGVLRALTLDDAKTALAKGWDIEHLKSLNPNLSVKEAEEIFELTLELLLETRETQKRTRITNAVEAVLKEDPASSLWQTLAGNLMQATNEKSHFDPYDQPVLLLAETEFNLALWAEQIPAIEQLAPRQQVSSLVELAMALGKTDVISPAVLCLLADGKTLPILVMPESLLPSVAARLQERIGQGFNMEIRVVPIDRGEWSLERIDALREELATMRDQRIPLVWSSTDIQTLVNSYIESLEEVSKQPDIDSKKVDAWKKLFSQMRSSAEIIGDEIHAILDILTSYNFSLGLPQQLHKHEMEAVADFIKVVVTHPDIAGKVSLPFLGQSSGTPLTEEYFNTVLVPKLVKTLIERGITNDPRSKELFDHLNPKDRQLVQDYLSSSTQAKDLKQHRFFPAINMQLIEKLEGGKKVTDAEIKALLSTLLPSDRRRLEKLISNRNSLVVELKKLNEDYQLLENRIHNFLATQKESLRVVFSLTATAQKGKHYVMNKAGTSAIPADNGTPLWDSQFGSSLERLFYTGFLFSQENLSRELIQQDIELYVEKYQKLIAETLENLSDQGELDEQLFDHPLIKEFEERYGTICHLKERGFTEIEIDQLTKWVNEKIERQMPLIRDHIFIEQKVYPQEIETSTHMFPLIAKPRVGLKGTTGTLYNIATFPKVFTDDPHLSDTTPKIVERIGRSSPEECISVAISGTPEEVLTGLYANSKFGPGSIIDTTGYIKKEQSESYARAMLKEIHAKNPVIEGVVYYEGDTLKVIRLGKDEPSLYDPKLPRDTLVAIWDVAHTTGSNIIINPSAHAFLVVGKHIRLFELLQASMRLRGLGSGQKLEIAVSDGDRSIIAEKLSKYLNIKIEDGQPLSRDHIFQYALLNEVLEETGNNWRAVDMRMRMVVLKPIMALLWDVKTSPGDSVQIFNIIKGLFLKDKNSSPSDQYGQPILKVPVQTGMKNLLESWVKHPVLEAIKTNPGLFPQVNVAAMIKELETIAVDDPGPIQPLVDSESTVGMKQRSKDKVQAKVKLNTKVNTREKDKVKERTQLFVKKRDVTASSTKPATPLRRKPYNPQPVIPLPSNVFSGSSYIPLPLKEAARLEFDALQPKQLATRGAGASVKMTELLDLDPSLSKALQIKDEDISVSLNLSPVWTTPQGVSPLYTPYHFFQKFATHALLIHDKASNTLKLELIDANDSDAVLEKLKQDRSSPNKSHDVNLSLYHLQEGRIIASGATPINPQDSFVLNERKTELLAQAKLLSGITQYSKEEMEFLDKWIKERNPREILKKFVLQIAQNREQTLELLVKSDFGKLLQNNGISQTEIEELLESPQVKSVKDIYSLLFDRGLPPKQWFEIARKVKDAMSTQMKPYAAKWSDVVVPLLPVVFDILHSDGASSRQSLGFINRDSSINEKAAQRRWLMNIFFPSISDEYGAWRTAVPQLKGKIEGPKISASAQNLGTDADLTYLQEAFKAESLPVKRLTAPLDQLEAMSELAHPIWGLPLLAGSLSVGEFGKIAERVGNMKLDDSQLDDYMFEDTLHIPIEHQELAKTIANQAIGHVDLVASLKSAAKANPDYQFERLYGTFAYLAKQKLSPEARREYALLILPRMFGEKLGKDMRFYTQFIPEGLTIQSEAYSKAEITHLLEECYKESAITVRKWEEPPTDEDPSLVDRSLALRAFAKDAPESVAKITTEWVNNLLATKPNENWWIDTTIFQLLLRNAPLIDYQKYKAYFDSSQAQAHISHAFGMGIGKPIAFRDQEVIVKWGLSDFDLFSSLTELKIENSPVFTPYQMAEKWAKALKTVDPLQPSKDLWHRVLGGIAEAVRTSPPTLEADKAALRSLLTVLDAYSLEVDQRSFEMIQDELGPIRLAADYSFDLPGRQKGGFAEIKKLPVRDGASHKVYHYFISHFLLPRSEVSNVPTEAIKGLFNDLHTLQTSRYDSYEWESLYEEILNSFTFEGTTKQKEATSNWISSFISQSPKASLMSDVTVINGVTQAPEKVEHNHLVAYVKGRETPFIAALNPHDKIDYSNEDFDLFAELFQLKTANRVPLPYAVFAKKMTDVLNVPDIVQKVEDRSFDTLSDILKTIKERTLQVSEKSRDKKIISELVQSVDNACEYSDSSSLIEASNQLRLLSDFSDPNPNVNIQKAILDLFTNTGNQFHSDAIAVLIPLLLGKAKDTSWLSPTLNGIINNFSSTSNLSSGQKEVLDRLLKDHSKILPGYIDQMLPRIKAESNILNYLLQKLSPDLAKINHASLKSYFHHIKDKTGFLYEISRSSAPYAAYDISRGSDWAKFAQDNLDIFMEFMQIPTLNRPAVSLQDLARWTETSFSKFINKDDKLIILRKFIQKKAVNPQERQAVSSLIKKIERTYEWPSVNQALYELRLQNDFTGTPQENIVKALNEFLDPATSSERRELYEGGKRNLYEGFISEYLFGRANNQPVLISTMLDLVNASQSPHALKAATLVLRLLSFYGSSANYQAASKWLSSQVTTKGNLPPITFELFSMLTKDTAYLDYSTADLIWKKMSPDQRKVWLSKLQTDLSSDRNLENALVGSDFRAVTTFSKVPLLKYTEPNLSMVIQHTLELLKVEISSGNVRVLGNKVVSKLPTMLFGFGKGTLSTEEAKALTSLINVLKTKKNSQYDGLINTLQAAL